jgi:hypothetical protein
MNINNLSQFKAALKAALLNKQDIHTLNANTGDMGIRKLSIVQSNSFAFATTKNDGEIVNSWCQYEKAGNYEFNNSNVVKIFCGEGANRRLILTYTFL